MSRTGAFLLGALGGLLPILVSLLTVDLAALIDHHETLTMGNYVGYAIRLSVLLTLGGTVAVLNSEVQQPFSLVQLGIAAPALVTSFINAAPASVPKIQASLFSIVSSAHAEANERRPIRVAGGFLADVVDGIRPGFGRQSEDVHSSLGNPADHAIANAPSYPPTIGRPAQGGLGNFCMTPLGVFGPGPLNPVGAPCNVPSPQGVIYGQVINPSYGQPVPGGSPSNVQITPDVPPSPTPIPSTAPSDTMQPK